MATKPNFVIWRLSVVSEGSSLCSPGARQEVKAGAFASRRRRIPLRETPLLPIGIDTSRCGAENTDLIAAAFDLRKNLVGSHFARRYRLIRLISGR